MKVETHKTGEDVFPIISLGWGAQSFALAAMSALGVLPKVAAAVHADTRFERSATYEFAKKWTPWLEEHGIKVVTVRQDRHKTPVMDGWGGVFIPAFTIGEGIKGQLRRQCTYEWKIAPIRRWLQKHRQGRKVELWMGITLDEVRRVRQADVKYINNRYPFLETKFWGGTLMRRSDVTHWLRENLGDDAVPSRSACYFCPYHSKREWRDLRDNGNGDWEKAVEFDIAIRDKRPPYDLFISNDCVPLAELDLSTPEDHGQLSLWDDECEGMCGV